MWLVFIPTSLLEMRKQVSKQAIVFSIFNLKYHLHIETYLDERSRPYIIKLYYLFIYLFICLFVCLFIYLFIYLFTYYLNLYLPLVQMIAKANKLQQNHKIKQL